MIRADLHVGQRIKDNDPRMGNRVLTITHAGPTKVVAENVMRRAFTIARERIYTDGKPRRTGFSVVTESA